MKLEILSLKGSSRFNPKVKTYPIRIASEWDFFPELNELNQSENWLKEDKNSWYYFDDRWPSDYKEYSWIDINGKEFEENLKIKQDMHPRMTKESLMGYIESRGHAYARDTLFDHEMAKKILMDFEEHKNNTEQVMINCIRGKNRSPAIGIAMNEIYDWGINGLKEKFPGYRRFVYDIMKESAKELF